MLVTRWWHTRRQESERAGEGRGKERARESVGGTGRQAGRQDGRTAERRACAAKHAWGRAHGHGHGRAGVAHLGGMLGERLEGARVEQERGPGDLWGTLGRIGRREVVKVGCLGGKKRARVRRGEVRVRVRGGAGRGTSREGSPSVGPPGSALRGFGECWDAPAKTARGVCARARVALWRCGGGWVAGRDAPDRTRERTLRPLCCRY